jgi:hypothetical protein
MFYVGIEFDQKENKQYKTESGGKSAAEKAQMRLYDDNGNVVADYTAQQTDGAQEQQTAPDAPQDNTAGTEGAIMTNTVPDSALEDGPDGDVKVYDDNGNVVGKMTADKLAEVFEKIADSDCVKVSGKIRRKFNGVLRVRNRASWEPSAVAGVTNFDVKHVVGLLNVNGKPMYKTNDGYFITGDPALVEYVAE